MQTVADTNLIWHVVPHIVTLHPDLQQVGHRGRIRRRPTLHRHGRCSRRPLLRQSLQVVDQGPRHRQQAPWDTVRIDSSYGYVIDQVEEIGEILCEHGLDDANST